MKFKSGFTDCSLVRASVDEPVTISGRLRLSVGMFCTSPTWASLGHF